jgi:hypothetical protein
MNDRQELKLSMFQKVLDTCREHEQVYAGFPAFTDSVGQLDGAVSAIRHGAQQQAGTITQGYTAEKNLALDRLAQQSLKVADITYVYAFRNNNQPLLRKVAVNKSMFYKGHDNNALALAKNIAVESLNHASELANYGIDSAELVALQEAVAGFELLISKPQTVTGEHKLYTGNLKQLFAEADSILYDQLDKLITLFKVSVPDFYTLYKNARNIINVGRVGNHSNKKDAAESKS